MALHLGDEVPTGWRVTQLDAEGFSVTREPRLEQWEVLRRVAVLLVPAVFIGWLAGTSTDETSGLAWPLILILLIISVLAIASVIRQVRRVVLGVGLSMSAQGLAGWPEPRAGLRDYWRGRVRAQPAEVREARLDTFVVTPTTTRFRVVVELTTGLQLEGPEALLELPALREVAVLEGVVAELSKRVNSARA